MSLLEVRNLGVRFRVAAGLLRPATPFHALDDVSFQLGAGETIGIVGESGCGKSTLARTVLGLTEATEGEVSWRGKPTASMSPSELRSTRREIQPVFQDPRASLDPRMTLAEIVAEPLGVALPSLDALGREERVGSILERVGLSGSLQHRYPHEFSGGQCQRIAIARALIGNPALLVCDEPVSALDVSIQAQIINLLRRLQRELRLSMLFVSHNLAVVRYVSTRVLVLYLGRTMELASRDQLYSTPFHPYTRALLAAIPDPARVGAEASGEIRATRTASELPSSLSPPSGCVFRTRCPFAIGICAAKRPALERVADGRWVACHRWEEVAALPARETG